MIDSRIWEKEWADARIKDIDGFTVGFQPGKLPGPIHWEMYCDMCKRLIKRGVVPHNRPTEDLCDVCKRLMDEL